MDAICTTIPREQVRDIIDLGSGTGRFSAWLAETFEANVFAVEPSEKMRKRAYANNQHPDRIQILPAAGEALPLPDASVDVVFLSMVYHHLSDVPATLREIYRVLRIPGYLVIRNTTRTNLPQIPMFQFFPSARVVDGSRMPDRQELIEQALQAGLEMMTITPVRQLFAASYQEYLAKLLKRSVSTLRLISDDEFSSGIIRLAEFCVDHGTEAVYEEHDLFIAQRID